MEDYTQTGINNNLTRDNSLLSYKRKIKNSEVSVRQFPNGMPNGISELEDSCRDVPKENIFQKIFKTFKNLWQI